MKSTWTDGNKEYCFGVHRLVSEGAQGEPDERLAGIYIYSRGGRQQPVAIYIDETENLTYGLTSHGRGDCIKAAGADPLIHFRKVDNADERRSLAQRLRENYKPICNQT